MPCSSKEHGNLLKEFSTADLNAAGHCIYCSSAGPVWKMQNVSGPAQAFLAASLKTDAELLKWFRDRLVWNEPETVVDLLKNGLFVRLYEPQVGDGITVLIPFVHSIIQQMLSLRPCTHPLPPGEMGMLLVVNVRPQQCCML